MLDFTLDNGLKLFEFKFNILMLDSNKFMLKENQTINVRFLHTNLTLNVNFFL